MFFNKNNRRKKSAIFLTGLFLSMNLFAFLITSPAHAQIPVTVTSDIPANVNDVLDAIQEGLLTGVMGGLLSGVSYFARKLAYDTAVFIASGGKGQGALVFQDGFDTYLGNTLKDSAADAISKLGEPFGLGLCGFPDVNVQLYLQIGLRQIYGSGSPTPNCSWQQLEEGFSGENFEAKYGPGFSKLIPEKFSDLVSVKNSDFGIALGAISRVDQISAGATAAAQLERTTNQGFKDVKDLISGRIRTPAQLVQEETTKLTAKHQEELSTSQIAGIYGSGLLQVLPMAASVFINTLASQLMTQLLTDGLLPSDGQYDPNIFGITNQNKRAAQNAFSDLLTPRVAQINLYDNIAEYVSCPPSPGLNNCVMDADLRDAIVLAQNGTPLTIAEAMDKGLLSPNKPLISPRRAQDNTNIEYCHTEAYCYSNIQKLRKARILPLGFEIAAFKADPDNPQNWTLEKVVKGFDKCDLSGQPSPQFPYCGLINPNWIIKAPTARCTAQVNGPELLSSRSPERREECVDLSTCINTDASGNCLDYGFCTKEKNIWRLNVNTCEPQYATCKTYVGNEGGVNYLERTLDFGSCDADSVGCQSYSLEKDANGDWINSASVDLTIKTPALGRNQVIFFNSSLPTSACSLENAEGCSLFYRALRNPDTGEFVTGTNSTYAQDTNVNNLLSLQKAPDYLGCYDTNPNTVAIDWPVNVSQALNLPNTVACQGFARACAPQEVGCDSFTRLDDPSAPAVPGIIGGASCPLACVGYDTYRQKETSFEPQRFPLYFIPAEGQSCASTYAGCDEFTNIEEALAGGEGLEYYSYIKYCERPTGQNEKTYYSWEGSATEGFTIKIHRLAHMSLANRDYTASAISAGQITLQAGDTVDGVFGTTTPAYADVTPDELQKLYDGCNEVNYNYTLNNPDSFDVALRADNDCRQLFDEEGGVYYRIMSGTVTVDNACHSVRKTESYLEDDLVIQDQNTCEQVHGGVWQNNICQRCTGGGTYQNGVCVYDVLSSESDQCTQSANGCREYVGNTGNALQTVLNDSFEPASTSPQALLDARAGWAGDVQVVAESLVVGQYSLRVGAANNIADRLISSSTLIQGQSYELTFWARGVPQALAVSLVQGNNFPDVFTYDPVLKTNILVSIGNTWREYTLGPVEFTGSRNVDAFLRLERFNLSGQSVTGEFYVDNIRLRPLRDRIFLIKDSWKKDYNGDGQITSVPNVCDIKSQDAFPGEALGCKYYENSRNEVYPATGFESLCRSEAVGCEPVYDTQNTVTGGPSSTLAQAYNIWCNGAENTDCKVTVGNNATGIVESSPCRIPIGANGCFVNTKLSIPTGATINPLNIVTSTIIIPADTPSTTPIFLTNRDEFSCDARAVGCQLAGLEQQILPQANSSAFTHSEVLVQNYPDLYEDRGNVGGILCQEGQVGCAQYQSGANTVYFKDPAKIGGATCSYRDSVRVGGSTIKGWFLDGVGQCNLDRARVCTSDTDCGTGDTCTNIGSVACYQNFVRRTNEGLVYDIHSAGDQDYAGLAGNCAPEDNRCTELVDPADTSTQYPNGKPYYVIFDNKVESKVAECAGQVSLPEGCALFDQTDRPEKLFNSTLSYRASEQANPPNSLVSPVSSPSPVQNDANLILKVDRDRECSEWLACKGTVEIDGPRGNPVELCYEYRSCRALGDGTECGEWVSQNNLSVGVLDENLYLNRGTNWYDEEYSGYTLFNKRQINDYSYVSFDFGEVQSQQTPPNIVKALDQLGKTSYVVYEENRGNNDCLPNRAGDRQDTNTNWRVCGSLNETGGRCYARRCIYPAEGRVPDTIPETSVDGSHVVDIVGDYFIGGSCKAYPEGSSPFPSTVLQTQISNQLDNKILSSNINSISISRQEFTAKKEGFDAANICQDGAECSCEYKKYIYRNGKADYWPLEKSFNQIPAGVCEATAGTAFEGLPCATDLDCNNIPGSCSLVTKRETHIGLQGYCLEPDLSRPINGAADRVVGQEQDYACLTWLPSQVSASTLDIYNTFRGAGYVPEIDAVSTNPVDGTELGPYGHIMCALGTNVSEGFQVYSQRGNPVFVEPAGSTTNLTAAQILQSTANTVFSPISAPTRRLSGSGDCNPGGVFSSIFGAAIGAVAGFLQSGNVVGGIYGAIVGSTAGSSRLSEYEVRICTYDRSFIFSNMQAWATQFLGGNAMVLRVESGDSNNAGGRDFDTIRINGNANNPNYYGVYHFAPNPPSSKMDAGTVMHGPRRWEGSTSVDSSGNLVPLYSRGYTYDQGRANIYNKVMAQTMNASDEFGNAPTDFYASDSILHTQRSEVAYLNKNDLHRVYFVPLAYPAGAEGVNPRLLTDQLYIDFTELDSLPSVGDAIMRNVSADSFYSGVGSLQSGDYFGPDVNHLNDSNNNVDSAFVWSYKLERATGCSRAGNNGPNRNNAFCGLHSFDDYDYPNNVASIQTSVVNSGNTVFDWYIQERNNNSDAYRRTEVASRYVMVFLSNHGLQDPADPNNGFPSFIGGNPGNPPSAPSPYAPGASPVQPQGLFIPNTDPFDTSASTGFDCEYGAPNPNKTENWLAIGLDFNADGEFLGFISRWCPATPTGDGDGDETGIQFATIATLNDQCTEYAEVFDETNIAGTSGPTNKAWTDRVWQFAKSLVGGNRVANRHPNLGSLARDQDNTPFGSLRLLGNELLDSATIRQYTFRYPSFNQQRGEGADGVPYRCADPRFGGVSGLGIAGNNCGSLDRTTQEPNVNTSLSYNVNLARDLSGVVDGYREINQLFMQIFRVIDFDTKVFADQSGLNSPNYLTTLLPPTELPGVDNSGNVALLGNTRPPQIYSTNPITCSIGPRSAQDPDRKVVSCTAGEANNITINNNTGIVYDYDGDLIRENDLNGNGIADAVIGVGQQHVRASFFAYADKNRGPIRKVMVDWGDGGAVTNEGVSGFYKNHKPYCSDADDETIPSVGVCGTPGAGGPSILTELTCEASSECPTASPVCFLDGNNGTTLSASYNLPQFGNAPRACVNRPFNFTHDYACSSVDIQLAASDPASYPWVQTVAALRAVNADAANRLVSEYRLQETSPVCVYQPRVQVRDNWGWCNGVNPDGTPSLSGYYAGVPNECLVADSLPWTPYQGVVVVVPTS